MKKERENCLATVKNLNSLQITADALDIRNEILTTLKDKSNESLNALQQLIEEDKKII